MRKMGSNRYTSQQNTNYHLLQSLSDTSLLSSNSDLERPSSSSLPETPLLSASLSSSTTPCCPRLKFTTSPVTTYVHLHFICQNIRLSIRPEIRSGRTLPSDKVSLDFGGYSVAYYFISYRLSSVLLAVSSSDVPPWLFWMLVIPISSLAKLHSLGISIISIGC